MTPDESRPDAGVSPDPDSTGSGPGGRGVEPTGPAGALGPASAELAAARATDGDADAGHLGWRISGLLDGELSVTEEIVAREHLADCDHCQTEFAEVMAARAFVRGLGEVEPPTGYVDRIMAHTRRRMPERLGLAGLVGIAALWICLLIISAGLALPDVAPPVDRFVDQHELAASAEADPTGDLQPLDEDGSELDPPFVLPDELASGFERVAAYEPDDDVVQVLYRQGDTEVSLFEQEGRLDWSDLPAYGRETEVAGRRAWVGTVNGTRTPPGHVVIVPDGPVVYTLVTTGAPDPALALAPELPEPQDYSWSDRARRNVETLAERIGL